MAQKEGGGRKGEQDYVGSNQRSRGVRRRARARSCTFLNSRRPLEGGGSSEEGVALHPNCQKGSFKTGFFFRTLSVAQSAPEEHKK